ncbi:MAG: 2-oxoacid:acceptor oxidoreductase subunit alpha [Spirochaetia bacterium]|nr:2-oxoacid:acceptor oxidoreductase subunit alpha [Spirochaetia bacterium]
MPDNGKICKGEIVIVLAGEAGQGIQSIEGLLAGLIKKEGFHVFASKEYMSRVRGGVNTTEIRMSEKPVRGHTDRIDLLIPLNNESIRHLANRIDSTTVIIGDNTQVKHERLVNIPFQSIASEFGDVIYSNTVAVGAACGLLGIDGAALYSQISSRFASKGEEMVSKNLSAAKSGYAIGSELRAGGIIRTEIKNDPSLKDSVLINGSEAVALGAINGGCDCVFAYPMTPGTGVFTAMAGWAKKAAIAVEQVEDEIGVMNMSLGAWYAGGRAMVSTSGGGFALMTEGVSLAGMIESPAVIHLAQRPAPATGLPTRTMQGDLNMALYAGHGSFARVILAPGNIEEAYELSKLAFELADRFQVPAFILTDQYLTDIYYDTVLPEESLPVEKHIIEAKEGYRRYAITPDGVSPRGVPGFGSGFICADSDEHDEDGRITEDLDGVRVPMTDKRMRKFSAVKTALLRPRLYGPEDYETLIVSWGSNLEIIKEAMALSGKNTIALAHFPQLYPLHEDTAGILKKAKRLICFEQNETGQFADLIKLTTGINITERVLKYNGLSFSVEEVLKAINN